MTSAPAFKLEVEVDPAMVLQETEQRLFQEIHNVSILKVALTQLQRENAHLKQQLGQNGAQYFSGPDRGSEMPPSEIPAG